MAGSSTDVRAPPRAIIFDLFQTLVFFDGSKLPVVEIGGKKRPTTIVDLQRRLHEYDPALDAAHFLKSIAAVQREITDEKRATGREITSCERFRRALVHATDGWATRHSTQLETVADNLVEAHMATLASAVYCPEDRYPLLESLAADFQLGLLSNFDHGPTAHAVLDRLQLSRWFDVRVVSDDVGYCKPAPEIFALTCERMKIAPPEALFVGDSLSADVHGAAAAGLKPIWVGDANEDRGPAVAVIKDVTELPQVLRALRFVGRT